MTFTIETIKKSGIAGIFPDRASNFAQILTRKQAEGYLVKKNHLLVFADSRKQIMFFTDDNTFGNGVFPSGLVCQHYSFPLRVSKDIHSTGIILSVQDFLTSMFNYGKPLCGFELIQDLPTLVSVLNEKYQ